MTEEERYAGAWRRWRRGRWAIAGAYAMFLLLIGVLYFWKSSLAVTIIIPLVLLDAAIWIIAILYHASLRCPRCDENFVWGALYGNPFTRKCVHCGLRAGADPGKVSFSTRYWPI